MVKSTKTEIIAEIGQNHNGDMELARRLIRAAKESGADVAKFQVYDADKVFGTDRSKNPWHDYNRKTQLTKEQIFLLAEECKKIGIEFMASVFDVERISWLEEAGVRRYKIASRSVHDRDLIDALIKTGKPLIASLGFWKEKEFPKIDSKSKVDFLYCISKYPTPLEDVHLESVDFEKYSGFSDHTIGVAAAKAAFARGACVVEKHFTLDKNLFGPDHMGSATPDELNNLNNFRNEVGKIL